MAGTVALHYFIRQVLPNNAGELSMLPVFEEAGHPGDLGIVCLFVSPSNRLSIVGSCVFTQFGAGSWTYRIVWFNMEMARYSCLVYVYLR